MRCQIFIAKCGSFVIQCDGFTGLRKFFRDYAKTSIVRKLEIFIYPFVCIFKNKKTCPLPPTHSLGIQTHGNQIGLSA